ncbi:staygreen family protein [Bacillus sp. FSL K6-3431]|uniref:staygreen family protein n=1 Tax=Bacillus sp. FSL K6-3431 TaxID=2921500 RepID=UPI0030FC4C3E
MEKLRSYLFTVKIMPPATKYGPVDGRKYTLTSKETDGSRILTIDTKYAMNAENVRCEDILTAEWMPKLGEYTLSGKVFIGGNEYDEVAALNRYNQLQDNLPEMIQTLIKGDSALYRHVPWLLDAPIYITYDSHIPHYNVIKQVGTPRSYLNNNY